MKIHKWAVGKIVQSPFHPDLKMIELGFFIREHWENEETYVRDSITHALDEFELGEQVYIVSRCDLTEAEWDEILQRNKWPSHD